MHDFSHVFSALSTVDLSASWWKYKMQNQTEEQQNIPSSHIHDQRLIRIKQLRTRFLYLWLESIRNKWSLLVKGSHPGTIHLRNPANAAISAAESTFSGKRRIVRASIRIVMIVTAINRNLPVETTYPGTVTRQTLLYQGYLFRYARYQAAMPIIYPADARFPLTSPIYLSCVLVRGITLAKLE